MPQGVCRWCEKTILKPDGTQDKRRRWHPDCLDHYLLGRKPLEARRILFARDRGVCAACGRDTVAEFVTDRNPSSEYWRRAIHGLTREPLTDTTARIFAFNMGHLWAADHILPLVDGGSFELDNLQTLCVDPCHKAKTAREAAERAARRNPKPPKPEKPKPEFEQPALGIG